MKLKASVLGLAAVIALLATSLVIGPAGAAPGGGGGGGGGGKPAVNLEAFDIPAQANLTLSGAECSNHGSTIDIVGDAQIGGVALELTYKNSVKGQHSLTTDGAFAIDILRDEITGLPIPKQGNVDGPGGNPWIYLVWANSDGSFPDHFAEPEAYVPLGRCVQGFVTNQSSPAGFAVGTQIATTLATTECSPKATKIDVESTEELGTMNAKIVFSNKDIGSPGEPGFHVTKVPAVVSLELTAAISTKKGWGAGGVGGNPHISLQWKDHKGFPGSPYKPGDAFANDVYEDQPFFNALGTDPGAEASFFALDANGDAFDSLTYYTNYTNVGRCKAILRAAT